MQRLSAADGSALVLALSGSGLLTLDVVIGYFRVNRRK